MILSSKCSIKFANRGKRDALASFSEEFSRITKFFIDLLWEQKDNSIPALLPKEITSKVQTWLSARAVQASGKQASGIVRGTVQKHKSRMFMLAKMQREHWDDPSVFKKLQSKVSQTKLSKPYLDNIHPVLDSRFVKIEESKNSFDLWVNFGSLGDKLSICVPVNRTKHLKRLMSKGYEMGVGVRLLRNKIEFCFEKEIGERDVGERVGIDIGIKSAVSCSNGFQTTKDNHGHDLDSIQKRLSRRKKGSNGFARSQDHRTNYINWSIKQLNLNNVKEVRIEDIKYLRSGKTCSRWLGHWTYRAIFDKIELECKKHGVHVSCVDPTYTSQRCSECGWTQKGNRDGKEFRCLECGYECDSDLNGSVNISLDLRSVGRKERLLKKNRGGFYLTERDRERVTEREVLRCNEYSPRCSREDNFQ